MTNTFSHLHFNILSMLNHSGVKSRFQVKNKKRKVQMKLYCLIRRPHYFMQKVGAACMWHEALESCAGPRINGSL